MAEIVSDPFARPSLPSAKGRARIQFADFIHINWPLLLGGLLVLFVVIVAIFGPRLAPEDPMATSFAVTGALDRDYRPIFGTDALGRDVLSRVLWGVRPTMTVVVIVAAIRLLVGTILGAVAGWSGGRAGRTIDSLIASSLTVPVLLVALVIITALAGKLGLWAFVLGMAVTGWAETGRIVREQTRSIKGHAYVEAAQALGGSSVHIVWQHVLRQISSMLWMLLAFEVSGTLLVTAGLGFLGYYVGGDIWVPVSDFVYGRFSGKPELGEMLGGNLGEIFTSPQKFVAAGTMVFITVLGFNLLGEGLRRQFSVEQSRRRTVFSRFTRRVSTWTDERVKIPLSVALSEPRGRVALAVVVLLIAVGGYAVWRQRELANVVPVVEWPVPGGHLWASQRRDGYGTGHIAAQGPSDPTTHVLFREASGFSGGPVIDASGNLYITSNGGTLYALDESGGELWSRALDATPVGTPALGAEGQVYVVTTVGGLKAFSAAGEPLWEYVAEPPTPASSGPVVGNEGNIYYTRGGNVQAVSAEGAPLWLVTATTRPTSIAPVIEPTGRFVSVGSGAINVADGTRLDREFVGMSPDQFIVGGDGHRYIRVDNVAVEWDFNGETPEVVRTIEGDMAMFAYSVALDSGVTRDGIVWMTFGNEYEDARIAWVGPGGEMLGVSFFPQRPSTTIIATDVDSTAYACGIGQDRTGGASFTIYNECVAFEPGASDPTWSANLSEASGNPSPARIVGGAMIEGLLYVATADGVLYVIGSQEG